MHAGAVTYINVELIPGCSFTKSRYEGPLWRPTIMNRVELLNAPKLVDVLEAKFLSHTATVGIIGMGYVGLPLARAFALKGFKVIGLDIDTGKVAKLNAGQSYIKHIAAASYADLVKAKQLVATTDFGRLAECDAIAICVPTPLTRISIPICNLSRA